MKTMFLACTHKNKLTSNSVFFKRFIVDSLKRIKTVVWKRIDRRVFHDNENAYFWKRSSVDRQGI